MENLVNKLKNLLKLEVNFNEIDGRKFSYKTKNLHPYKYLFSEDEISHKRKIVYLAKKLDELFLAENAKYGDYAKEVFKDYEDLGFRNVWVYKYIWLNIPFEKCLLNALLEELEK